MRSYDILWLIKPGVNNIVHTVFCQSAADKCLEICGWFVPVLGWKTGFIRLSDICDLNTTYTGHQSRCTRHRSKLSFV